MSSMEHYVRIERCYKVSKDEWTCDYAKNLWDKLVNKCIIQKLGKTNWNGSMAWNILYNKMDKAEVFKEIAINTELTIEHEYINPEY